MMIKIKLPKKQGEKWQISFGGKSHYTRTTATSIFNIISRKIQVQAKREKVAISVWEYIDSRWENINESVASQDIPYLLYAAASFLEDYLSQTTLGRVYKIYEKNRIE